MDFNSGPSALQVECSVCHEVHTTMVKSYLNPGNLRKGWEMHHVARAGVNFVCEWCSVIHCSNCKRCVCHDKCLEPGLWRRTDRRCNGALESEDKRACLDKVLEVRLTRLEVFVSIWHHT